MRNVFREALTVNIACKHSQTTGLIAPLMYCLSTANRQLDEYLPLFANLLESLSVKMSYFLKISQHCENL